MALVMLARPSALVRTVIGCAIEVHRTVGPGLLESAYEACLTLELHDRGITFARQVPVPMLYKSRRLDCGYRADLIVENELLVELKAIERLLPKSIRRKSSAYLKLVDLHHGLIINFNVRRLVDGIRSVLR